MKRYAALPILLVLFGPLPAAAQSIFATGGLGVPVSPVDARARALGGIGVGLREAHASLTNPAAAADYRFRGLSAALQSMDRAVRFGDAEDDVGANRFPLLRFIYPVGQRLVFSAGYGGFLDQSWAAVSERTESIGGEDVLVRDLIDSSGGIAQLQAGVAYLLTPSLAVGVAGGFYTGELDRRISRTFPEGEFDDVQAIEARRTWTERAPYAVGGVRWDILPVLRVAGSVTWAGTLEARASDGREGDPFDVDLPLQLAGGLSAVLSPRLLAVVSGRWAGWSSADGFGEVARAVDTWEVGGGLEWSGPTLGGRAMPLRLGYHYSEFPFAIDGNTPSEQAFAAGLGLRFGLAEGGPLATIDAALERGSRTVDGGGLAEDFWRATVSLSVFGR